MPALFYLVIPGMLIEYTTYLTVLNLLTPKNASYITVLFTESSQDFLSGDTAVQSSAAKRTPPLMKGSPLPKTIGYE